MSENFFFDNPDLQFRLEQIDLREALDLKEKGYSEAETYPGAPRNYADAKDNYRIVLDVLGEICGERVAPRAGEADEEGAHFEDGVVTYAAAMGYLAVGLFTARPAAAPATRLPPAWVR